MYGFRMTQAMPLARVYCRTRCSHSSPACSSKPPSPPPMLGPSHVPFSANSDARTSSGLAKGWIEEWWPWPPLP